MKKTHLLPLILFCVVFLAYVLYFVKVVNQDIQLERNSIGKLMKRSMELSDRELNMGETSPASNPSFSGAQAQYVDFTWLNLRKEPDLGSELMERLEQGDEVAVIEYTTPDWVHVRTASGADGYVARRYLSEAKPVAPHSIEVSDLPIVTYHHVTDDVESFLENLTLPVNNFLTQLDYLVDHQVVTMTFSDVQQIRDGVRQLPEHAIVLTFDDGYADHYQVAQHLNGKGMKGVFFVIPDLIGQDGYLSWTQLQKMVSWGMEIGLHNNADLTTAGPNYLTDFIGNSKTLLESQIGISVIAYAYPSGRYSEAALEALKALGIQFARTLNPGNLQLLKDKPLELFTFKIPSPQAAARQFQAWGIGL
ncbi:MAG: polysaccharide deacetylase family protein [bacterium]|nr:polysaccharide deacetylase family protein [bacterium]